MSDLDLTPFSRDNADIVLEWRNSGYIRYNMLNDTIISHKEHIEFIDCLENDLSRAYFLVELKKEPVAALYFTDVGEPAVTWGCYIGTGKVIPGLFVTLFAVALTYVASFGTTRSMRSEVAEFNSTPIRFNRFLDVPRVDKVLKHNKSGALVEYFVYEVSRPNFDTYIDAAKRICPKYLRNAITSFTCEP